MINIEIRIIKCFESLATKIYFCFHKQEIYELHNKEIKTESKEEKVFYKLLQTLKDYKKN